MPYALDMKFAGTWIKLCACDGIAEGLYRGKRYSYEYDKFIPVNRYLCEQCADNMREMDDAEIALAKRQVATAEAWDEWDKWYQENAH